MSDWLEGFEIHRPNVRNSVLSALHLSPQMFGNVVPGVDALPYINAAIAALKAAGGGTLMLPQIGGSGYVVSDRILIDASNILVLIYDDITLSRTTVGPNEFGVFVFAGAPSAYIDNVGLVAPRRKVKISSGASLLPTQTYDQSKRHFTVGMRYCRNIVVERVYAYDSYRFGICTEYCLGGRISGCDASVTLFDNGIQVGYDSPSYSATDPATWSSITIENCRAWNCKNYGIGTFGASGVSIINPKVWNCGNNTPADGNPGIAGGINVEQDPNFPDREYYTEIINPQVDNCFGRGIYYSNCKGRVIGGYSRGAKKGSNWVDDPAPKNGHGVLALANADVEIVGTELTGNEGYGAAAVAYLTRQPKLRLNGSKIRQNLSGAAYGFRAAEFVVAPNCIAEGNGTASVAGNRDQTAVVTYQGSSSDTQAVVSISGEFRANLNMIANVDNARCCTFKEISGYDNGSGNTSAYHQTLATNCDLLFARNFSLIDRNSKTASFVSMASVGRAIVDEDSMQGQWLSAAGAKVRYSVITARFPPNPVSTYGDQGDTIFGYSYAPFNRWTAPLTANRTVVLNRATFTPGSVIEIARTSTATGAFSLNVTDDIGTALATVAIGTVQRFRLANGSWIPAGISNL